MLRKEFLERKNRGDINGMVLVQLQLAVNNVGDNLPETLSSNLNLAFNH